MTKIKILEIDCIKNKKETHFDQQQYFTDMRAGFNT